ncbi:MAG TPA: type IV secretory system conjugative DNA transfer family protein [Arachidicoccus soli]|uniref:Type IV secretory system conjugative DNA transfer family protein n=1 Tax=Arachidicoccus soli TaxID=2341117 RepID=A0A386HSS0_9BACT|nr:type IV secretory system conjugative DNA transfer family protein [Arachidicoccus soli]AYD49028.1 type IV secretory system conjugative DNA transfer family protein [Arachidicoccus soli]HEU0227104.1 type IV secretory system conjugative DNA transfer family protein [Arachidicoccus soli]
MEQRPHLHKIYGMLEMFIYLYVLLDVYINTLSLNYNANRYAAMINSKLWKIEILTNPYHSHWVLFLFIVIMALCANAKKKLAFNFYKQFLIPFIIGIILFGASIFFLKNTGGNTQILSYGICYLLGAVILNVSIANLTKRLKTKLKKDIWNEEEESFEQNREYIDDPELLNLPMQFYYRKKINEGWMNINPFRGIMVIGVPGSGKSESVIIPSIKQFLAKGYSMLVYDFKYPTLASITYYNYLKNKQNNGALKGHAFHCINLGEIEYSRRVNPLLPRYISTLAKAGETADAIVSALKKGDKGSGGGSDQFFTQSAINFLSASIYFLAHKDGGKYSSLPHLLAFLALPYETIFNHLFSMIEVRSLLSSFVSSYKNKALEQLEGQVGTLRINISRLATPETFWVFSGNDLDLKISNPKSILVLANSIDEQNINSAFYAAILNRTISEINSRGNNPCALIIDEVPTLYLHKIENLIATARSNKVAVILGLQELPQFIQQYGEKTAETIYSLMGSVIAGAVRSKGTLQWLETLFGRIKQSSTGINIDRARTSINLNERMDTVIPPSKIANQNAGEVVAIVSRGNENNDLSSYQTNTFKCKIKIDLGSLIDEKKYYRQLPKYYDFGSPEQKRKFLLTYQQKIYDEIENMK